MTLRLNFSQLANQLQELARTHEESSLYTWPNQVNLHLKNTRLNHLYLPCGINCLLAKTTDDVRFSVSSFSDNNNALKMMFCLKGEFQHTIKLGSNSFRHLLKPVQAFMSSSMQGYTEQIVQTTGGEAYFLLLEVEMNCFSEYFQDHLEGDKRNLLKIFGQKDNTMLFHLGNFTMSTAATINQILSPAYDSVLPRYLYLHAKVLEVIAGFWTKYLNDLSGKSKKPGKLNSREIEEMMQARNFLLKDLQNAPTIERLAKMVGVNENKLKRNFKLVFDNTIYKYLRDVRLEQARKQIAEQQDVNLERIAETIGYFSQSHFSRRFKEKYGVLPKDYAKSIRNQQV